MPVTVASVDYLYDRGIPGAGWKASAVEGGAAGGTIPADALDVRDGAVLHAVADDAGITAAEGVDDRVVFLLATAAFTSANANIAAAQRSISAGDLFVWDESLNSDAGGWSRLVDGSAQGGTGGLDAAAVRNLIADPAEQGNADPWPAAKLPDAAADAKGILELATASEARAGTDGMRAVTPAALAGLIPVMAQANRSASATDLRVFARATDAETAAWTRIDIGEPAQPARFYAAYGADTTWTAAEFESSTTGRSSTSRTIGLPPGIPDGSHVAFAWPAASPDPTFISNGTENQIDSFVKKPPVSNVTLPSTGGTAHAVWEYDGEVTGDVASGSSWTVRA